MTLQFDKGGSKKKGKPHLRQATSTLSFDWETAVQNSTPDQYKQPTAIPEATRHRKSAPRPTFKPSNQRKDANAGKRKTNAKLAQLKAKLAQPMGDTPAQPKIKAMPIQPKNNTTTSKKGGTFGTFAANFTKPLAKPPLATAQAPKPSTNTTLEACVVVSKPARKRKLADGSKAAGKEQATSLVSKKRKQKRKTKKTPAAVGAG